MKIYIVRHGQDNDTVRGGWSDTALTSKGISQAKASADYIKNNQSNLNIEKIISSDLKRACQTAEILADALELDIEFSADLREVDNGVLSGMKNELAEALYPNLYWRTLEWDECYPDGESPKLFYERVSMYFHILLKKAKSEKKNLLIVTHGGVINVIKSIVNNEQYSNTTKYQGVKSCTLDFAIEVTGL